MANRLLWFFLRLERVLCALRIRFLARIVVFFVRIFLSAQIPESVQVGPGTVFGYGGLGLVIHKDVRIGSNCRIGAGVTLGSRNPDPGAPVLGNNIFVGTGAKILGSVTIGDDSVIGANAVVLKDVPPRSIAVGVPARVVKSDIDISKYNETFYEH